MSALLLDVAGEPEDTPAPAADAPMVISYGLGVDSTSYLARVLADPDAAGIDPAQVTVVHAVTGDEWPDTLADTERYVLPLLREHSVRLVQVSRSGPSDRDGVTVLDDTRRPRRMVPRGPWALSDELRTTGTVPQIAHGRRICSIKFKGWVIDRFLDGDLGDDVLYRHVIGFNADEAFRALRDQTYTTRTRAPEYPLLDWQWDRERCEAFLQDRFAVTWRPSYCAQCPFPGNIKGLPGHLARLRAHPQRAADVLGLELTALALNPRSRLFGSRTLCEYVAADGNTAALAALNTRLQTQPWALYEVRRITHARKDGGKGPSWRAVRTLATGPRATVEDAAGLAGGVPGHAARDEHGLLRCWWLRRGAEYPAREAFVVAGPAGVVDKQRPGFETAWARLGEQASEAGQIAAWSDDTGVVA